MDIADVGGVGDWGEAEFVGFAEDRAWAEASACEPHGEGVDVVVAACGFADFAHGGASEFTAPDDDGIVEEAALGEVGDEGGAGLVDVGAFGREVVLEVFGGAAVVVPVGVVELDEADPAFDEAASEEAIAGEGTLLLFADAVEVEGGLGFGGEVHEFRGARLHAVGHFEGFDAGGDFVVAGFCEMDLVELADGIDELLLFLRGDAIWGGEADDGVAFAAEGNALEGRGEDAAGPERGTAAWAAGAALEDDEAWEVVAGAAEAVGDPCAHAGTAEEAAARIHEEFRRGVVEEVGLAGADDGEVVDDFCGVREVGTDPCTGLAVLLE